MDLHPKNHLSVSFGYISLYLHSLLYLILTDGPCLRSGLSWGAGPDIGYGWTTSRCRLCFVPQ